MKKCRCLSGLLLALVFGFTTAQAQDYSRARGEDDLTFAKRVLQIPEGADPHVTAASWNGIATLFVDDQTSGDDAERSLVALQKQPDGQYRKIDVTVGEQEGGVPDIAAIGFANADHAPAKDLIVILAWGQTHHDFEGTLYEVRIFGVPRPDQTALTLMKISQKFGSGCECGHRDGKTEHFRFKTIEAVKAELTRLGY